MHERKAVEMPKQIALAVVPYIYLQDTVLFIQFSFHPQNPAVLVGT